VSDTFLAGNGLASRAFYAAVWWLVAPLFRLYTRMTINGREHIPKTGAFVLAPVHRSYVDTPISGCITRRRLRFMGKQEMWKHRYFGWVFSALGGFPVNRGHADREAMRRAIAVLEMGEGLVLFPEGERKDGPLVHPLFDGAVYIAVKAGVPIVPVGIGGSALVMPRHAKFVYPRKVHVEIGPPIMPPIAPPGGRLPRSAVGDHSAKLHAELQRLFDEAMSRVGWDYDADGAAPGRTEWSRRSPVEER
jgi:1-acyl-sn-glycerol-3-phosphate acyltransferase